VNKEIFTGGRTGDFMDIEQNISNIRASLPEGVKLVAVSKFHPVESIKKAYEAGQRIFGESRVQELTAKQPVLPEDIEWHFIGTLQTNKVRHIAPFISMIQSVDTLKLLQEINRQAAKCNRTAIRVLIEVHIAEEAGKHGFSVDETNALFTGDALRQFPCIRVCGLMGMATFTDSTDRVRREFGLLRHLFEAIKSVPFPGRDFFTELSMGMSDDYQPAVEEGSTMVRIGTGIFGTRPY
jgi:pyridoxal phosphate enzyme (YggS family)